jgi:glycerate 2-kinase
VGADCRPRVQTYDQVTSHGKFGLREVALGVIQHALEPAYPSWAVKRILGLQGATLRVGGAPFELSKYERILVLGARRASRRIVLALEEALDDRIAGGLAVLKHGDRADFKFVSTLCTAHPIRDSNGCNGAAQMLATVDAFGHSGLVFAAITGGSSALSELPEKGISPCTR